MGQRPGELWVCVVGRTLSVSLSSSSSFTFSLRRHRRLRRYPPVWLAQTGGSLYSGLAQPQLPRPFAETRGMYNDRATFRRQSTLTRNDINSPILRTLTGTHTHTHFDYMLLHCSFSTSCMWRSVCDSVYPLNKTRQFHFFTSVAILTQARFQVALASLVHSEQLSTGFRPRWQHFRFQMIRMQQSLVLVWRRCGM